MKILIVSPTPTHTPNAGNRVRILALASELRALGYQVYFAYVHMESADIDAMAHWWGQNYFDIPYTRPTVKRSYFRRLQMRVAEHFEPGLRFTYCIDDWFDDKTLNVLHSLDREFKFDAVMVEYVFMSKALEAFSPRTLKIIDTHDVFTNRHELYLANQQRPQWFSTTQHEEGKALRRADAVIAIQEKERTFFESLTQATVVTVGHLVRVEPLWKSPDPAHAGCALLFVGSGNPINVRCVEDYMETIFPRISEVFPETRLLIAGTICEHMADRSGMVKLGALPDISDAYRQADIVVNPVSYGTGLNIKTVEALGFGMPMVSTSVGAKGLGVDPLPLLVADGAQSFASEVLRLMVEPKLAAELSSDALSFARKWNLLHGAALAGLLNGHAVQCEQSGTGSTL